MDRLSVGMTKEQVVSTLGPPVGTTNSGGNVEMLDYLLPYRSPFGTMLGGFHVKLREGLVESYGSGTPGLHGSGELE